MENQSNTEWDYKEKQPCLFNIPSWVCITINVLELLTIMAALKLWGPALCGQCFIIRCDNNNNSMLALNSGRSRTVGMQLCLCEIWFLAALHDFELTAIHIPGLDNRLVDHFNHWHMSPFHKTQFQQLTAHTLTTHVACPAQCFDFEIVF